MSKQQQLQNLPISRILQIPRFKFFFLKKLLVNSFSKKNIMDAIPCDRTAKWNGTLLPSKKASSLNYPRSQIN